MPHQGLDRTQGRTLFTNLDLLPQKFQNTTTLLYNNNRTRLLGHGPQLTYGFPDNNMHGRCSETLLVKKLPFTIVGSLTFPPSSPES